MHLVPGLYFRVEGYPHPINVATTKASDPWAVGLIPDVPTVFQRLAARGVQSAACLGGLTQFPGPWREAMLRGAAQVPSLGFPALQPDPEKAVSAAIADIGDTLARPERPPVVFAYVDLDTSVHRRGYDDGVLTALHALDTAAHRWAREGITVAAVSDHGLVPVAPSTAAIAAWRDLERSHHCRGSGGAGRMRWLYARQGSDGEFFEEANAALGEWADVHHLSTLLLREPLRSRIGEIVAIARSPEFPLPTSELGWDHGAHTAEELLVPFALWGTPDGAACTARALDELSGER